jgi:hypothetical protein
MIVYVSASPIKPNPQSKNLRSCGGLECGASYYAVRAILLDIRPWGFSEKPEGGNFSYNQAGARASPEEDLLIIDTFVSLFYVNDISSGSRGRTWECLCIQYLWP